MSALSAPEAQVSLNDWLVYLPAIHPQTIELGLTRVSQVASVLALRLPMVKIVVGGTNGKGSTCAMLEAMLLEEIGQAHKMCIKEWQEEMEGKTPEEIQEESLGMCKIDVTYNEDVAKISLVVVDTTLRGAILAGLKALSGKVKSGPAPPSAMEDQLEDWLEMLMV